MTGVSFDAHGVEPALTGVTSVFTADFDGDGDLDVLSASARDNTITWFENLDGQGAFGNHRIITNMAMYAQSVHAADIDGDGDMDALSASAGADDIVFDDSLAGGAIRLTLGELVIREVDDLRIIGPGPTQLTIDASGNDPTPELKNGDGSRIFNIMTPEAEPLRTVEIRGLRLTGGDLEWEIGTTWRGGGALRNELKSLLKVEDSIIEDNSSQSEGGAILALGDLTLHNVILRGNHSGFNGGGIAAFARARIADSWLVNNSSEVNGGAIYTLAADLLVTGSTISNNETLGRAGADGAGMALRGGVAEVINSTIAENVARGFCQGGGIHASGTALTIRNSTIFGNSAGSDTILDVGSGINIYGPHKLVIENSIIAGNYGPDRQIRADNLMMRNSLVGTNQDTELEATGLTPDANGNLIGTNQSPINPLLGPLSFHGGIAPVMPLLANSPAINRGAEDFVPLPFTDQRGMPRVANGRLDMGAFEYVEP